MSEYQARCEACAGCAVHKGPRLPRAPYENKRASNVDFSKTIGDFANNKSRRNYDIISQSC